MKVLKRLLLVMAITCSAVYGYDLTGEVKSTSTWENFDNMKQENSAKLEYKMKGDDFYGQISLKGLYNGTDAKIDVYRAYVDLYKGDMTLTLGKCRILWGNGYFFNYTDIFNEIDFNDIKGDRPGVSAIKGKYSIGTSRIEAVGAIRNDSTSKGNNMDYAARYTFTLDKFEVMVNYLDYKKSLQIPFLGKTDIKTKAGVLEVKGEMELGFWGAFVFKNNETKPELAIYKDYERIFVGGADYTFDLFGKGLYTIGEYSYNDASGDKIVYLMYKYDLTDDINISQTLLADTVNNSQVFGSTVNHTMNDYITLNFGYNKYYRTEKMGLQLQKMFANHNDDEVIVTVKCNF